MKRVPLIHWNAREAALRIQQLDRNGFAAELLEYPNSARALRALADAPPDAIVIDLTRLPSHGLAVAEALRQRQSTRGIPLVFLGGTPEKVQRVRSILPDATFGDWECAGDLIARAINSPPAEPTVPALPRGYSGTPLPRKLGIKPGSRLLLLGEPEHFRPQLGNALERVRLCTSARDSADLVILFAKSARDLRGRLPKALRAMAPTGTLWIAWPKKTSGVETDLSKSAVRQTGLGAGLVEFAICAVDQTWSGLRFARRKEKPRPPRR